MRISKGIVCLNCKIEHPPGIGYHFTEDLSIVCEGCDKIIFATTQASEDKMPKYYSTDRKSRTCTTSVISRSHYCNNAYDFD